MNIPQPILQAHCQSRTSPNTAQSFVKELAKPTHVRQIQRSKLKDKMTENNEHQPLTSGIKLCGLCGYAGVLPRIKFIVTRHESSPQSATKI